MSKVCACGVELEFAVTPTGKKIPLNKIAHIYRIEGDRAIPMANVYQSHFLTCPKANEFSGKNRT